jgi:hypothetical protein
MPLIPCPECAQEVSERAVSCPKCGHPIVAREPHSMILDAEDETYLCVICPKCNKEGKIKKVGALKTSAGYSLKGKGNCSCGFSFDKIALDPSNPRPVNNGVQSVGGKKKTITSSFLILFILVAIWASISHFYKPQPSDTPITPTTPAQSPADIANNQLSADSDSAKIRAKEFVEASLKAPSTAKWPWYDEFAVARHKGKKGKIMKDVWDVSGYVDAQNSYGAMIRTKWFVTVLKTGNDWNLVKIDTW